LARQLGLVLGALDLEAAQSIRLVEPRLDLLLDGQGHLERQRGGSQGRPGELADGGIDGAPSILWQMGSASRWPRRWQ